MVLRPAARSLAFGCPGLVLATLFTGFAVQGLFAGQLSAGLILLAFDALFAVMWLPFVIRFLGTRLVVYEYSIELRRLFGLRRRSISRSHVHVTVQRGNVGQSDGGVGESYAGIPIAYYDIVDRDGRVWKRLSTWFWRGSDCERLSQELSGSGSAVPWRNAPESAGSGFGKAQQSIGCLMQGASGMFGFAIGAVFAAALFHIPMGRTLGAAALPGFFIGLGVGSTANLSGAVYRFLNLRLGVGALAATSIAVAWMFLVPVALWFVVLFLASVIVGLVVPPQG